MQMTAHGAQAPAWPLPTPLTHHQEAPFETRCQEPSEGARGTNAALFSIDALAGRPQAPAAATQGGSQPGTVGARPPPAPLPPQDVQQPPAAGECARGSKVHAEARDVCEFNRCHVPGGRRTGQGALLGLCPVPPYHPPHPVQVRNQRRPSQ